MSHKHYRSKFALVLPETKSFQIGGQKIFASILKEEDHVEVVLKRVVTVMDADDQKEARRRSTLSSLFLQLELTVQFGGREDLYQMTCVPQDL